VSIATNDHFFKESEKKGTAGYYCAGLFVWTYSRQGNMAQVKKEDVS